MLGVQWSKRGRQRVKFWRKSKGENMGKTNKTTKVQQNELLTAAEASWRVSNRLDEQKQWLDEMIQRECKTMEHVHLYAAFRNTQSQQIEQGAFIDGYFDFLRDVEERRLKHECQNAEAALQRKTA